jgi:hypothetical protein
MSLRKSLNAIIADQNFQMLDNRLREESAFHILKIADWERSHSAFLCWLLNPTSKHGMGNEPLKSFLFFSSSLVTRKIKDNDQFIDSILIDKMDYNLVEIETEFAIREKKNKGSIDIFCYCNENNEKRPILIIEYKVRAKETSNQTKRYSEWSKKMPRYDEEYRPLHIYLIPKFDAESDNEPSHPFVIMDYSDFSEWLEHIKKIEKSPQAKFLLNEFESCLKSQQLAPDEFIEYFKDEIIKTHQAAINEITNTPRSKLIEESGILSVLRMHRKAFEYIGVETFASASKGTSVFITKFREELKKQLTDKKWKFGGVGCLIAKNISFQQKLNEITNQKAGRLQCHFYMDRPDREKARFYFSFYENLSGFRNSEGKILRQDLARSLRNHLENKLNPKFISKNNSISVFSIPIELPGLKSIENDDEKIVIKLLSNTSEAIDVAKVIDKEIDTWIDLELSEIIDNFLDTQSTDS